jgi:hypothetical protein
VKRRRKDRDGGIEEDFFFPEFKKFVPEPRSGKILGTFVFATI